MDDEWTDTKDALEQWQHTLSDEPTQHDLQACLCDLLAAAVLIMEHIEREDGSDV